jgi:hypothetical protein
MPRTACSSCIKPQTPVRDALPPALHPPQRAAMTQSALAKERRELKDQQNRTMMDAIPKDLSRPWEDPMPEPGERHLAAVGGAAWPLPARIHGLAAGWVPLSCLCGLSLI